MRYQLLYYLIVNMIFGWFLIWILSCKCWIDMALNLWYSRFQLLRNLIHPSLLKICTTIQAVISLSGTWNGKLPCELFTQKNEKWKFQSTSILFPGTGNQLHRFFVMQRLNVQTRAKIFQMSFSSKLCAKKFRKLR